MCPSPAPPRTWPSVTVVVVTYDGRQYLDDCLRSLEDQDYPADLVEVVLIDNASTDGTPAHVARAFPWVRLVVNDTNTGFAPAVNQGAELAGGTYLALINNDAHADPGWLREAVAVAEADPAIACVASKILRVEHEGFAASQVLDFGGGQLSFYGHGFAKGAEHPDTPDRRVVPTLFASGGAMVARAATFRDVGGFDGTYFAFFEDVDLGWRLWLLGHEVRYVPASVVHHRHHGTIRRFGYARERYLLERNALATVFKNWSDEQLARALPASLVLTLLRGLEAEGLALPDYRISADAEPIGPLELPPLAGAHLAAIRDWAQDLDELRVKRTRIQRARTRSDREILKLFEQSLRPNISSPRFLDAFRQVVEAFDLADHARPRSRVLLLTDEPIGPALSAAGIRAWETARTLAHEHEVVLASTQPVSRFDPAFATDQATDATIQPLLDRADVVVSSGLLWHRFPELAMTSKPLVLDVADPFQLDALSLTDGGSKGQRRAAAESDTEVLNAQLGRADLVVAASEKQRDYWLGQLAAVGRINPATFDMDGSLRNLLDVAGFGLPAEDPRIDGPLRLRGVVEGLDDDPDDEALIVLAPDGCAGWADPLTLIRAMVRVAVADAGVKLVLSRGSGGADGVTDAAHLTAARRLADELGLTGRSVFFLDEIVSYDERAALLAEADMVVTAAQNRVDTAYGLRPQVLDAVWMGLPLIVTIGDASARLVAAHDLGLVVPPGDARALGSAILRLAHDDDLAETCGAHADAVAPTLRWWEVLTPLLAFCRVPASAADRRGIAHHYIAGRDVDEPRTPRYYVTQFASEIRRDPMATLILTRNIVWTKLRARLGRGA